MPEVNKKMKKKIVITLFVFVSLLILLVPSISAIEACETKKQVEKAEEKPQYIHFCSGYVIPLPHRYEEYPNRVFYRPIWIQWGCTGPENVYTYSDNVEVGFKDQAFKKPLILFGLVIFGPHNSDDDPIVREL